MRLLLDTHTLLWFLREPEKLPQRVLERITASEGDAVVSLGTLWEIAIKTTLNKLRLPKEYEELFPSAVTENEMSLLQIEPRHLATLRRLPLHHRDPFDRLLIAQALTDELTLVSCDPQFPPYGVDLLW